MNYEKLPKEFIRKMELLLGEEFNSYLDSFHKPAFHGLRINTLKTDPETFFKNAPWELKQVPWILNGFYYNADGQEDKPARHPYYYAGLYYLQEPSAMTPASLLPIEPGDVVLDLCAAPGGKSTELAAKLQGEGMLLSNDISNSRAKALLKNLELFGAENILVTSETPEKLSAYFEGFFDKILIDAPCSGEGMFRRDKDMVKSWLEKGPDYYSKLQREIGDAAVEMLKPGGMLLYSTCTFDEEEDEGTIRYLLEAHRELKLVNLEKQMGFVSGTTLPECVRLFPHQIDGEGHFIALIQKEMSDIPVPRKTAVPFMNLKQDELLAVNSFLELTNRIFDKERFYLKNDSVYYLPVPLLQGDSMRLLKLRYLRTGLLLGELKKGRFEPSQAFAMALKKEEFKSTVHFTAEDDRTIRYLKGETVSVAEQAEEVKDGWCLVCVDGFPLGFAKKINGSLKNKYYPGWRWQ